MNLHIKSLALIVLVAAFSAVPVSAKDNARVRKDLTAVIALHGMPCGSVVSFERQAQNDYIALCQDGNRYRVFVNAKGRVVVEKK